METLKLRWLGHPLVEWKGRPIKLETRKAAALLAYLSLTPGECQREVLATMFWQEGNQQKALANLRRTLSSLNSNLPGWIQADRETIALVRNAKLRVDVDAFHQSLSEVEQHNHPENKVCDECLPALEKTVELYRGDFLDGLNLNDSPLFDDWQFFQRDGLRQEFEELLKRISTGHAGQCRWDQAIVYARRWLALDRLHEPASRALMDLYARSGQRVAALRQYDELARLLNEQLGQEPEEETRRLYEQIRGRDEAKRLEESPTQATSFPLLKTKLYIPTAPAPRVERSHLIARLSDVAKKALTIISAPAGFGKTTLLAEWIAQTSIPIAWLSLDSGDNDPYRYLSYLIAALESIHENTGLDARQIMESQQLAPPHIILASLMNDLGKVSEPYVLVLDDYQFITEHAVHETTAYLLDHIPSNMHLIISTRADPPLQLGRLRVHDQMLELRTQDLRFSSEEAEAFLNGTMMLGLSVEDVESLETRTEGWLVGLKMAALSLKGHENASKFIHAFSGSHRYVLDYLLEEVLKRQPAHIQAFLLETSILEKLNGSLCDAVLSEEWKHSGERGQAILEYLERNNLFLISMDEELNWFRYHHLFADLLRVQLQKFRGNPAVTQLHLRAAAWHEQNGLILDAIHHASLASDDEMVERLIKQNYLTMMNRGEMSWVRFWTGNLGRDLIYRRPWLCLYQAMNCSWYGQLEEATLLLNQADKLIQAECSRSDVQPMLSYHAYVRSRVTAMQGNIPRAIQFCLTARENVPADNLDLQIDFSITLGYEYFLCGDFVSASRVLNETIQSGYIARAINNPVAAYCLLARAQMYQGQLQTASDLLHAAEQLTSQTGDQYLGAIGLIEVEKAALLCERNDLESALAHVKKGLNNLPWWGKTDDFCLAYITLARTQFARGHRAEAADAIQKAAKLIETCGVFSEARNALQAAQVKLSLEQADRSMFNRWAVALEKRLDSLESFQYENELIHITRARIFIAQDQPKQAFRLLSCLEEAARSGGRLGRLIEILNLKALALQAKGNTRQALITLTKSLMLAEPSRYIRIFLEEGTPMLQLLERLAASKLTHPLKDHVNRLLE